MPSMSLVIMIESECTSAGEYKRRVRCRRIKLRHSHVSSFPRDPTTTKRRTTKRSTQQRNSVNRPLDPFRLADEFGERLLQILDGTGEEFDCCHLV